MSGSRNPRPTVNDALSAFSKVKPKNQNLLFWIMLRTAEDKSIENLCRAWLEAPEDDPIEQKRREAASVAALINKEPVEALS